MQKPITTNFVSVYPTHADWTAVEIKQTVVDGAKNLLGKRVTLRIGGEQLKALLAALDESRQNLGMVIK